MKDNSVPVFSSTKHAKEYVHRKSLFLIVIVEVTSDAGYFVVNTVVTQYCVYYEIACIRRYNPFWLPEYKVSVFRVLGIYNFEPMSSFVA